MRKINNKIVIIIIVIIISIMYYLFYKERNEYSQFEEISDFNELGIYEETEEIQSEQVKEENKIIVVHITGEVKNGGVFELEEGARMKDAVNLAGGFTDDADIEKVNLAYVLTDAIKIYIPNKNEEKVSTTKEYIVTGAGDNILTEENKMEKSNDVLVNINKASQTELETLPGIGPSIAEKIISYREENGQFSNIEDIKNVSGIGENKFKNIKELICI